MNKDKWITLIMTLLTVLLIYLFTRPVFLTFANQFKYLGGFIKFLFLASLGDIIGYRIKKKQWELPKGFIFKAIIWGVIGVFVVMAFSLFDSGVWFLQQNNLLPNSDYILIHALFVSTAMNLTFGPMMMAFHRVTDTYIEKRTKSNDLSLFDAVNHVHWPSFISFVVFKTIPLFWIPAHTITFILPAEYRVIFAALLGIVLGLLLGVFNNEKERTT